MKLLQNVCAYGTYIEISAMGRMSQSDCNRQASLIFPKHVHSLLYALDIYSDEDTSRLPAYNLTVAERSSDGSFMNR